MTTYSEQSVWDCLRNMKDPATSDDVVSLGLIEEVTLADERVTVQLSAPTGEKFHHEALATAIRHRLGELDGVDRVRVIVPNGDGRDIPSGPPAHETVHLKVLDDDTDLPRPPVWAPEAGYGDGGPEQLASPDSPVTHDRYEGWPPVLQWEMDPGDSTLESGDGQVRLEDWDYDVWWQAHPAEIVFVSIQALQDDAECAGGERRHPMGRNVVVNLVWDQRRCAVVAIYGTTRDFRPFIEAFRKAYGLKEQESNR